MNPLAINPKTGYLESGGYNPRGYAFDSEKKEAVLALAMQAVREGTDPQLSSLCDTVGISVRTFEKHYVEDSKFRGEWDEIKARLRSLYTNELGVKARSKMGTLANIAMLRYLETGSWVPNSSISVTHNSAQKPIIDAIAVNSDPEITGLLGNSSNNPENSEVVDNQPV